jgi:Leucine-rich repeat (LRR) protein
LEIEGYPELLEFPDLSNSRKLRTFSVKDCIKTKSLPGLSNLKELRVLRLESVGLTDIQGLDLLNKLEDLLIMTCPNLKAIPNLSNMGLTLLDLCILNCKQIEEIHGVEELQNLVELNCSRTSIRFLPDLSLLTNLVFISVSSTPIQEIGGLPENLQNFGMYSCAHAEEIFNSVGYKTWISKQVQEI